MTRNKLLKLWHHSIWRLRNLRPNHEWKRFWFSRGAQIGVCGSSVAGTTAEGNHILRLNRNYALGPKGTLVHIPKDLGMYESVRTSGKYGLAESQFIASGLVSASKSPKDKVALVDIGSNVGLISLQAMNIAKTQNDIFLFEPIPGHVAAMRHNLKNFRNIRVNQFALSNRDGISEIFTEFENRGNSSMLDKVVPFKGRIRTEIRLVNTDNYFRDILNSFEAVILKCDTQGMDALILSQIPDGIWSKIQRAVIEVWALEDIAEGHVAKFVSKCQGFNYVSWSPDFRETVEFSEVSEFWLSKTSSWKNLYMCRQR